MTIEEMKKWIDEATYEQLLSKHRFAPVGDPFFMLEMDCYFEEVMERKREEVGDEEHSRISRAIGWG